MRLADFDFELPERCIAQQPAATRVDSRLLRLDRETGAVGHGHFSGLPDCLRGGDLLVLNDTRVIPARLLGRKPSGGQVELLLLERTEGEGRRETWNCWLRTSRKPAVGTRLDLGEGLPATILERRDDLWSLELTAISDVTERVLTLGRVPLPPYIRRPGRDRPEDPERYQTVYARAPGAVAAPTAGLHFSEELLENLRGRGVGVASLTLHVGPGTFRPIRTEVVEEHAMHEERYDLPEETADAIRRTRSSGGRVVAVGTTVVRTLEERATEGGLVTAGTGRCGLFIYPGFRFRVVDAMITNFHLPRSTLILLVAAFAGRERVLAAYREAIAAGYRFYSYGDAMFIGDSR